jgi:hypothetical protein
MDYVRVRVYSASRVLTIFTSVAGPYKVLYASGTVGELPHYFPGSEEGHDEAT